MTDWKQVHGTQTEKPQEFDTTSSKVYVYQRKNVERISEETNHGTAEYWQYDERKMSHDEYAFLILQKAQEQDRADIEYISAMTDIPLEV